MPRDSSTSSACRCALPLRSAHCTRRSRRDGGSVKLWGGRFTGRRDPRFEKFSESFSLDRRFVLYDLRVNLAYVKELGRAGVFKTAEARRLAHGLETIRRSVEGDPEWARGQSSE